MKIKDDTESLREYVCFLEYYRIDIYEISKLEQVIENAK